MVIKHNGNAIMDIWRKDNFLKQTGEISETPLHTYWNGKYKYLTIPITGKDDEQQELSFIVMGNEKIQSFWKVFLTQLNIAIPYDLVIMILDTSLNDLKVNFHAKTCP